jgi:hypothetical protein
MRDTEHFKRHLEIVTETRVGGVSCDDRRSVPAEDPFHHTRVTVTIGLLDWLKLLFGKREIEVRVHVKADGCAMGRWFQGKDICERCCRARLDDQSFEVDGLLVCEACRFGYPQRVVENGVQDEERN